MNDQVLYSAENFLTEELIGFQEGLCCKELGPDVCIGRGPSHGNVGAHGSRGVRYRKLIVAEIEMFLSPYSISDRNCQLPYKAPLFFIAVSLTTGPVS